MKGVKSIFRKVEGGSHGFLLVESALDAGKKKTVIKFQEDVFKQHQFLP